MSEILRRHCFTHVVFFSFFSFRTRSPPPPEHPQAALQLMASPAASPQLMASLLFTPKRHPLDKHTTQAFDEVFGEEHQEVHPSTRIPSSKFSSQRAGFQSSNRSPNLLSTRRISDLQRLAKFSSQHAGFRSSGRSPFSSLKPGNAARRPSVNTMDIWTHRWTSEDWKMDNLLSFSSPMMDTSS